MFAYLFTSSLIAVPFLNLMANIQQRAGRVQIRVGGNTQERAVLVDSLDHGKIIEKQGNGIANPVTACSHVLRSVIILISLYYRPTARPSSSPSICYTR